MTKSADAFRTITEVAELLSVPQHVLRFWETRFTQIRPVKRAGGRRYFRPADVALLSGIRHLLQDQNLAIRDVQKVLKDQGVSHVMSLADISQVFSEPPEAATPSAPDAPKRVEAPAASPHLTAAAPPQSPAPAAGSMSAPAPRSAPAPAPVEEAPFFDGFANPEEEELILVDPGPDYGPLFSYSSAPEAPIALDVPQSSPGPARVIHLQPSASRGQPQRAAATPSATRYAPPPGDDEHLAAASRVVAPAADPVPSISDNGPDVAEPADEPTLAPAAQPIPYLKAALPILNAVSLTAAERTRLILARDRLVALQARLEAQPDPA